MPVQDPLKDELLQQDPAFQLLYEEHQDSERRLQELQRRTLRTPEDEALEKQIKLHKLVLKDRMEARIRAYREARVPA
jgi:uncharacterized protein YdcH (DUF465 family)